MSIVRHSAMGFIFPTLHSVKPNRATERVRALLTLLDIATYEAQCPDCVVNGHYA